jgi:hypothetical protein
VDVTNPSAPVTVPVSGPLTLQMTLTDEGEPGSADTLAITLWDSNGVLLYSSNWNGAATVQQLLGGGNLVVH